MFCREYSNFIQSNNAHDKIIEAIYQISQLFTARGIINNSTLRQYSTEKGMEKLHIIARHAKISAAWLVKRSAFIYLFSIFLLLTCKITLLTFAKETSFSQGVTAPQICDANKTMSHFNASIKYCWHQKLEADLSSWCWLKSTLSDFLELLQRILQWWIP